MREPPPEWSPVASLAQGCAVPLSAQGLGPGLLCSPNLGSEFPEGSAAPPSTAWPGPLPCGLAEAQEAGVWPLSLSGAGTVPGCSLPCPGGSLGGRAQGRDTPPVVCWGAYAGTCPRGERLQNFGPWRQLGG